MGYSETIRTGDHADAINLFRIQPANALGGARGAVSNLARAEIESVATRIAAERRRRHDLFDHQLFADPAWDILLIMTIAECRQQRVTISKLCKQVDAPMTTALRWIGTLTEQGLLIRRDDPTDKRRKFVELSPHAMARMIEYCSSSILPSQFAA